MVINAAEYHPDTTHIRGGGAIKAILKPLALLLTGAAAIFFISCSHPIVIVGSGDVLSASGDRDCLLEDFLAGADNCRKNYAIHDYSETYYAVARPGWEFDHWVNYCVDVEGSQCSFNVPTARVHQFWGATVPPLQAVFTKIDDPDTVVVDDKVWLQPDLFTDFTWEQISAACPEGVCFACFARE